MVCTKCGSELMEGSRFCAVCGEKVVVAQSDIQSVKAEQEEQLEGPVEPLSISIPEEAEQKKSERNSPVGVIPPKSSEFVQPKKKVNVKGITRIAIAAVAIIAVVFIVMSLLSKSGNGKNVIAYYSDGKYELLKSVNQKENIDISSSKSDDFNQLMVQFSPDGKYIYYFTKYDPSNWTGTLCRAELAKLSEKGSKNDKYIENIASNVKMKYTFLDDGNLLYITGEDSLYYYHDEESTRISKDVYDWRISENDPSRFVYLIHSDDSYTLYGCEFKDIDNKIKLATKVSYIVNADDLDNILYARYADDDTDFYSVGFSKEAVRVGKSGYSINTMDGKTMLILKNGEKVNLYDYVEDPYAESDAGVQEPDAQNFSIPAYYYSYIDGTDLVESNYPELYTSCTEPLYWYGESGWWSYSMEESLQINWGDDTDAIHTATQEFIDKYSAAADSDGYILVTDEVKEDLKKINAVEPEDWKWMWLCCTRQESGTTLDYNAYNAAYDQWNEVKTRIYLREELQDDENAVELWTLYSYEKGKLTSIAENVIEESIYGNGIMYNTIDQVTEKLPFDDLQDIYTVKKLFYLNKSEENSVYLSNGTVCKTSSEAMETLGDADDISDSEFYFTDKLLFVECDGLYVAPISDGVVGGFKLLSEDGYVIDESEKGTVYYAADSYKSNASYYYDLYAYKDGVATKVANECTYAYNTALGTVYEDDVILSPTMYHAISESYELTMFDAKGKSTIINDNVTSFVRVNPSLLLYISDGDLYAYNGKENSRIRSDVRWVWSSDSMDAIYLYSD